MFYVLSSHNIHALKRQFVTLPKNETTVIINTLDKDYQNEAQRYCFDEKIRCVITESDGTAATGKNSFLDLFEDDAIEHAVLIDGDDYLTHYGVRRYKEVATRENPPDVICLKNQVNITWPRKTRELVYNPERMHLDPADIPEDYAYGHTVEDWDEFTKGEIITEQFPDVDPTEWIEYAKTIQHGMGVDEINSRVVFMSRKVIPYKFKNLVVGEDTIQFLELKDAFERGELTMAVNDEELQTTYIYDVRLSGIALDESSKNEGRGFLEWNNVLIRHIRRMKKAGLIHSTRIPDLEI